MRITNTMMINSTMRNVNGSKTNLSSAVSYQQYS